MILRQKGKQLTRATAGFLAVWLSGVVFLFCCEMMPQVQAASSENENCPLAKLHNSCDKSDGENQSAAIEKESSVLECCAMLPRVFDKARKIEKTQKIEKIASAVKISQLKILFVKKEFAHPKVFR